jgi:hypothetical protein
LFLLSTSSSHSQVGAVLMVSWDTRVNWDWEQWGPAYWNYYICYTAVTLLWGAVILAYRICLATKMPFTHVVAFVLGMNHLLFSFFRSWFESTWYESSSLLFLSFFLFFFLGLNQILFLSFYFSFLV